MWPINQPAAKQNKIVTLFYHYIWTLNEDENRNLHKHKYTPFFCSIHLWVSCVWSYILTYEKKDTMSPNSIIINHFMFRSITLSSWVKIVNGTYVTIMSVYDYCLCKRQLFLLFFLQCILVLKLEKELVIVNIIVRVCLYMCTCVFVEQNCCGNRKNPLLFLFYIKLL